jgi:spermidine synthase
VFADARDYLDKTTAEWDLIISDLTDPIENGPAFKLFTREFFEKCHRALRPGGILVLQGGVTAPPEMSTYVKVVNTLKTVFCAVHPYTSAVPTWGSPIGLALCSDSPLDVAVDPQRVDTLLAEATSADLRMFDGCALRGLLHPPKYLRDAIQRETVVYTLKEPPKGA